MIDIWECLVMYQPLTLSMRLVKRELITECQSCFYKFGGRGARGACSHLAEAYNSPAQNSFGIQGYISFVAVKVNVPIFDICYKNWTMQYLHRPDDWLPKDSLVRTYADHADF